MGVISYVARASRATPWGYVRTRDRLADRRVCGCARRGSEACRGSVPVAREVLVLVRKKESRMPAMSPSFSN